MTSFVDLENRLRQQRAVIETSQEAALVGKLAVESSLVVDTRNAESIFGNTFPQFWDSYARYDSFLAGVSLSTMDFSVFRMTRKHIIEREDLFSEALRIYVEHHIEWGDMTPEKLNALGTYVYSLNPFFGAVVLKTAERYATVPFGTPLLRREELKQAKEKDVRYRRMEEEYLRAWLSGPYHEFVIRVRLPEIPSTYQNKEADNRDLMRAALGELTQKTGQELVAFEQRVYGAINKITHWKYYELNKREH